MLHVETQEQILAQRIAQKMLNRLKPAPDPAKKALRAADVIMEIGRRVGSYLPDDCPGFRKAEHAEQIIAADLDNWLPDEFARLSSETEGWTMSRIAEQVAEKMVGTVHFQLTAMNSFVGSPGESRPACYEKRPDAYLDWPETTTALNLVTCIRCLKVVEAIIQQNREGRLKL